VGARRPDPSRSLAPFGKVSTPEGVHIGRPGAAITMYVELSLLRATTLPPRARFRDSGVGLRGPVGPSIGSPGAHAGCLAVLGFLTTRLRWNATKTPTSAASAANEASQEVARAAFSVATERPACGRLALVRP
jgi:hypothetical protein